MVALLSLIAFAGGCVMLLCVLTYCFMDMNKNGFPGVDDVTAGNLEK